MRYFIRLAYKGTRYSGWQVQPNANTVQAEVDKALSLILSTKIETLGCGRTDTGVHAADFFAHVDIETTIDAAQLVYKLNKLLPNDISIKEIKPVKADAHARFDATAREYKYYIERSKNPFTIDTAWYYFAPLNMEAMNIAAAYLLTIDDFKAFSKAHTDVKTTLCNVTIAQWEELNGQLVFTITANRFLRNMVRAIVGTLTDVGRGKITLEEFKQITQSLNRSAAGESAPAEGLFLTRIDYPDSVYL